jgi:agmatinase
MYNPNTNCIDNGNFAAIEANYLDSHIILFPTPWEATVSYREGTIKAPELIRLASMQLDLFNKQYESIDVDGRIYWDSSCYEDIYKLALKTRYLVQSKLSSDFNSNYEESRSLRDEINKNSNMFNDLVYKNSITALEQHKIVGLVGGDHSIPYGQLKAVGDTYPSFGIMHIDAHHDIRPFFQGFKFSHGSIFHNVLSTVKTMDSLVQIGIRDYCKQEYEYAKVHPKVTTFYDADISSELFKGLSNWGVIVDTIIEALPQHVYVSLDMDGLAIENTLSTGTPVPGGLSYAQVRYLIDELASRRTIIGFDVVECGQSEVDTVVAMRLIFQLCYASLHKMPQF